MTKKIFLTLISLLCAAVAFSQGNYTISGVIKDKANGETLIGATLFVPSLKTGITSNEYGFYSLTLPAGSYDVQFTYLGYQTQNRKIELKENIRLDIEMVSETEQLQEIVVQGDKEDPASLTTEMSVSKMDIKTIAKIPAFMGEVDLLRSIQFMPGVSTVGEGASGFNVRGGSVGQNLILLDEAPVYNSSHLLGFFSVFNPDAVKDAKLYKGAVPARFGGRIASLLDVRMKDGNNKEFDVSGGIGTVFSRLAVEGPIKKDKSSFIIAARRSYIDVLARPFVEVLKNGGALNFYDLTAKANYIFDKKNKVFLSGYLGRDNFKFDKTQGFSWGNATATLRWNHLYSDKIFSNVTLLYSKYDYNLQFGDTDKDKFSWKSNISNYILRPDFTYFINKQHDVNFGGEMIYYSFLPADAKGVSDGKVADVSLPRKYNLESSLYVHENFRINEVWSVEGGIRYTNFNTYGPGYKVLYNTPAAGLQRKAIDSVYYGRGKSMQSYNNWQPRFSFKAQLSPSSSIKGSYNRMVQYLHLISNTVASNPLDVWTPSNNNIKPELGDQFTLGWFKNWGDDLQYEFSVESYYRKTQNQIDYVTGADLLINKHLDGDLLSGKGRAYGVEFYVQKKTGRLNGWVSYTLGRTELKVDGVNNFDWYPTRFNQTHNLKVAAFYELNKRCSFSADFVFVSGTPATFPNARLTQQGFVIPYVANNARNNVTIPNYHRLDISFRLEGKTVKSNGKARKNRDYWVFSLYNVYGRKNPFAISFSPNTDVRGSSVTQATQTSIIGTIVPSFSYNFKF